MTQETSKDKKMNEVEVKKPIPAPAASPLHPDILAAITAAVGNAVTDIVAQLKTTVSPTAEVNQSTVTPTHQGNARMRQPTYRNKLQGIPVKEGQDLRDVPAPVINAWFTNIENRWKDRMNAQKNGSVLATNVGWTRGYE